MSAAARRRLGVRVTGVVQGVGFRPHVHRLAGELGLSGFVRNDARGVEVEVEGDAEAVAVFLRRLDADAPPLARIEDLDAREIEPTGERGFRIARSEGGVPDAHVAADAATCEACLVELLDPADRRHRYPFINCTDCGPRFTIVTGIPYDRPNTTMAGFSMCAACAAEYHDPADRRFHAQPNACPACGPRARLIDGHGRDADLGGAVDAVQAAARELAAGRIVAVKGIGGYHLACRADDEAAVAALRGRKHREEKPFALMAADLADASGLVELDEAAAGLLTGAERPVVLAPRRPRALVADPVAPRSAELGVMLPYTPLHHLLLADAGGPLVMTSGNVSDEPIAHDDTDALRRLAGIADLFLVHDRPIATRVDDSVVRATAGEPVVLRRSRGLVPGEVALPVAAGYDLLACGAELKNTFCLARGTRAWLGHHIGDLTNLETLASFTEGIEHFERLFDLRPEVVAHDLHPQYLSTRYAQERAGVRLVAVQHHHAHLAACLAEHGRSGRAVGAILDGAGYGTDGTVWGGEILVGDLAGFERAGHLWPARLPGGDRAAREPWRMAAAWLVAATGDPEPPPPPAVAGRVDAEAWRVVCRMAASGTHAPVTTSAGRLFDAVAAICGAPLQTNYEGQAAIELEASCDPSAEGAYSLPVDGGLRLDARPTIAAALADSRAGAPAGAIAMRFHRALAAAVITACQRAAERHGAGTAVLSGGVFQNRRLLALTRQGLAAAGLEVLVPSRVPPNDGGVAFGQAAVAAAADR